ncbi:9840_t:CDS:2, partial [Scutellospora calospora]
MSLTVDDSEQEKNIAKTLDQFDKQELDNFLSSFISWLLKKDRTLFKVESVHNCYAALARYLRENSSIEASYGDTSKSDSLTSDEIMSCLNHNYLSVENNENLERQNDSGFQLRFRKEKNNQDRVLYRQRYDLLLYLSKCPTNCESMSALFLQCIRKQIDDQRLYSTTLLILYMAYNKDLESYYSFPGDSYIDYDSDENDET